MTKRFYTIKDEVRILGFDDGPFKRGDSDVLVVGTVFRGGQWLDGVMSTHVSVDGIDSTEKLIELVENSRFKDVRVIMLDGLGFGGFNLVDIQRLSDETGLSVIVIIRNRPDLDEIKSALENLSDRDFRWDCILNAGDVVEVKVRADKTIYIQSCGIHIDDAVAIVKLSATRSLIPEPIRVSHLIASGIVSGQSKGKA